MANIENLIPFTSEQNREEAKKNGHKGGIASGKARREKATMLSTLRKLLDEEVDDSGATYRDLATLGLIKGAIQGNAINFKTILETLGEEKGGEKSNGVIDDLIEVLQNAKKDQ